MPEPGSRPRKNEGFGGAPELLNFAKLKAKSLLIGRFSPREDLLFCNPILLAVEKKPFAILQTTRG